MNNNQSIPVIDQFLQIWKEKTFSWYKDLQQKYFIEYNKEYEFNESNLKLIEGLRNNFIPKITANNIQEIINDYNSLPVFMQENWRGDLHYTLFKRWKSFYSILSLDICQKDDDYINKILDREVEIKKLNLITRIQKKAGNILDASGLYIAGNGEINGWILGDIKKVKVETISAGGYNIQCYHFRVLVK